MLDSNTRATIASQLNANSGARSLIQASMAWMDLLYDSEQQLLRHPVNNDQHMVRESLWYALGLVLQSRGLGDSSASLDRVKDIVARVLDNQYDAPGKVWHGTFRVTQQEVTPPDDAVIWQDYDPNWRQFIGTVLLLLRQLEGGLTLKPLLPAIDGALRRCIEGEPVDRVPPTYTNIALMKAWLEIECGELVGNDVRERGLAYATKIHAGFSKHGTFAEYNSPTYYGINFFALGLWQNFSQDLGQMGEEINRALWSDLSRYYHAGMKNLCGPWSRAYGMDMQRYVAAVGLWIWAATNREVAPFPATTRQLLHAHDFCLGPLAALSAVAIPDSVRPNFFRFEDTRQISQQIATAPARQADAYLAPDIMIGVESSARSFRGADQYHPLTIHWLGTAGVAWCRFRFKGRVEGDLDGTRVELNLRPDEGVQSASIEFHRNIQLSEDIVESDNLSMRLATRCKLSVDGSSLIIDLPDDADDEQVVSISCRVSK